MLLGRGSTMVCIKGIWSFCCCGLQVSSIHTFHNRLRAFLDDLWICKTMDYFNPHGIPTSPLDGLMDGDCPPVVENGISETGTSEEHGAQQNGYVLATPVSIPSFS